ncbi:hypothetical protein AK812_SmicGene37735 [Symbiodinium microadriaticum]|uniref:Uncharacterized protein n=1 Tax=Symbiodinium microadriaticum TaxID=2951 RepID=A0A1Q9CFJ2_SYMMI|nr:hypothetical protein AK812_SmicGene37735 [Symbiodinium microadriaticum]
MAQKKPPSNIEALMDSQGPVKLTSLKDQCNIERFLVVGEGGIGATLKRIPHVVKLVQESGATYVKAVAVPLYHVPFQGVRVQRMPERTAHQEVFLNATSENRVKLCCGHVGTWCASLPYPQEPVAYAWLFRFSRCGRDTRGLAVGASLGSPPPPPFCDGAKTNEYAHVGQATPASKAVPAAAPPAAPATTAAAPAPAAPAAAEPAVAEGKRPAEGAEGNAEKKPRNEQETAMLGRMLMQADPHRQYQQYNQHPPA